MIGRLFFQAVMVLGFSLFSLGIIVGRKRSPQPAPHAHTLRFALEWSFFAVIFGLIPFAFTAIFNFESVIWQLSSLLLAFFLGASVIRIGLLLRQTSTRWPLVTISLLVISAIMLTIELLNVLFWWSPVTYVAGTLWIITLAGLQMIVFICYVPTQPILATNESPAIYHTAHSPGRSEWMRSRHPAGDPYGAANRRTHRDGDGHRDTRQGGHAHRLAFTHRTADGRPIPNASIRTDRHTRAR
jgi:hypothetical protein